MKKKTKTSNRILILNSSHKIVLFVGLTANVCRSRSYNDIVSVTQRCIAICNSNLYVHKPLCIAVCKKRFNINWKSGLKDDS